MKQPQLDALFNLPPREAKSLSFCKTDKATLEAWIKALPMADMGKTTRMLYSAINEICSLNCSAAVRVDLADAIRPAIHFVCKGLKKSYMNQPIIMPEQPRKIANLCQALQGLLAKAYLIAACQCSEKMGNLLKKPTALMAKSVYFSLDEFTRVLVRNYILYRPVQDRFWIDIHRLYQLAARYQLNMLDVPIDAEKTQTKSVESAYMKLLLLGCIKANQLRQDDVVRIDDHIDEWADKVSLKAVDSSEESSFIIDPKLDLPPIYQKFYSGDYNKACRSMDTDRLVDVLKAQNAPLVAKKSGLSSNLINHLILAWGVFTGRTFMRLEANSELTLCIGLTTLHYFLAEHRAFNDLVHGEFQGDNKKLGAAEFKEQRREAEKLDVWDRSMFGTDEKSDAQVTMESIDYHIKTHGNSMMTFTGSDEEKYQNYCVNVVNMSPGGYCLEWNKDIPNTVKAGEIIGVKEEHHNTMNIGVIRWVRQSESKSLRIGVELLSPSANPYGARVSDVDGNPQSDFMRALILPEIKTAGQPSNIITPAVSFKAGQYILLAREGREHIIKLNKLISSTGSFLQFTFDDVKPLASHPASGNINDSDDSSNDSDLDSVWDLL